MSSETPEKHSPRKTRHSTEGGAQQPLRVLVAWRPESSGDESARFVAWLARTQPVSIRTATVIPRVWSQQPGSRENNQAFAHWLQQESEASAAAAREALRNAGVPDAMLDTQHPCVVETSHSETSVLIHAAEDFHADIMILGSHPAAPRGRFRIGSTADALLHCSPIPLGLSPREPKLSKRGITRVNCSYVDTEQSHQALRLASDLAVRWGVALRLVAFSPRGATMYPTTIPFSENYDMMVEWREQALALLDRGKDRALARHPNLSVHTEAGAGYGWSGAVNDVKWKKGDILVMGSSVLGDFNRVFIGPSTNQILRHSPVPVIISPV